MPTAELQALLSVNNKPFINGMNQAVAKGKKSGKEIEGAFSGISSKLAGALSVGAFALGGRAILGFAGEIQDTADKLNLTTDAVQGFSGAFAQSGATMEVVSKGFIKLNENLDAAREGSKDAQVRFAALGISMDDVRKKSPEQIMLMIADAVKGSTDPVRTLASVMELLGKSGSKMLPGLKNGAEGLKAMMDEIHKLTPADIANLDAAGDAIERFGIKAKVAGAGAVLGWKQLFDEIDLAASKLAFWIDPVAAISKDDYQHETWKKKQMEAVRSAEEAEGQSADEEAMEAMAQRETDANIFPDIAKPSMDNAREAARKRINAQREKDAEKAAKTEEESIQNAADALNEAANIRHEMALEEMSDMEKIMEMEKDRLDIVERMKSAKGEELATLDLYLAKVESAMAKQRKSMPKNPRSPSMIQPGDEAALKFGDLAKFRAGLGSLQSGGLTSGGLTSGGLGSTTAGSSNAYNAVRSGDAARDKAAAKAEKEGEKVFDPNTAEMVRLWGGEPKK